VGLAERAGVCLAEAGYGAVERGDLGAAHILLLRAYALLPDGDARARVAIELAYVLSETGEMSQAKAVLQDAVTASDPAIRAQAIVADVEAGELLADGTTPEERAARRAEAYEALTQAGDDFGLARYWLAAGYDGWAACQSEIARESWERGLRHAQAAGAVALVQELQSRVLGCLPWGPLPAAEAVERIEAIRTEAAGLVLLEAAVVRALGRMRALEGRLDEAREHILRSLRTTREAGLVRDAASHAMILAFVERRAGDSAAEERVLREGLEELERLSDRAFLSTVALELAECLVRQDKPDEARALCEMARGRTLPEDVTNFICLDEVESLLAANAGQLDEAEQLARSAVARADTTDFYDLRGNRSRGVLAEILARRGKADEAVAVASEALALHEAKGDVAGAALLRDRFAAVGIEVE